MFCDIPPSCFDYNNDFDKKIVSVTTIRIVGIYNTIFLLPTMCKGEFNYCDFVEDSTTYNDRRSKPEPHYKLDSIVHLSMF